MNNNGAAPNEGSSSGPNRPPATESPRRRSGGARSPHGTPRGRGSSSRPTTELALFTPPRVPNQSADGRAPPVQHWPPAGSSGVASGSGRLGFAGGFDSQGGQAIPVGHGGSGGGGAVRVGGSPLGRKRGREGGAAGGGGGNEAGEDGRNYHCSVCNKAFSSPRAVFGHMRKHPDRGWTGAHPPPAFRAAEEFGDIHVREAAEDGGGEEVEPNYRVPDLNNPPPPDSHM